MNNWTEGLEFYLKTPYEVIQFPVAPQEFSVDFPSLNKTINVLNFGEVPILGGNALRTWTISSFFQHKNIVSVSANLKILCGIVS